MEHLKPNMHLAVSIITAIIVFGALSFIFADRFDSKNYISDELTQDELLEPIVVKVEAIPEKIAYEEVLKELEDTYSTLNECTKEIQPIINNLYGFYEESEDSIVCRDANIAYNNFSESYERYRELLREIKLCTATYEDRYNYLQTDIILSPDIVNEEGNKIISDEENMSKMYVVTKEKADRLYNQDIDIMARVGFAEAGAKLDADPKEHYAVWGVIYNRVKDSRFPNTTYDVIHSGAYTCVSNGSINKKPPELVKKYAEEYLRGYVDFDMPEDVVFQSRSKQTSDVWWESPLGHYFCRK